MNTLEWINLISSLTSLILAVLAIWLSLHFYDKAKESEKTTEVNMGEIKTQTHSLEKLTGTLLTRLAKAITSAGPADDLNRFMAEKLAEQRAGAAEVIDVTQVKAKYRQKRKS